MLDEKKHKELYKILTELEDEIFEFTACTFDIALLNAMEQLAEAQEGVSRRFRTFS